MFPDWTIAHGGALFVLSHLPSRVVQAVCTSPPYYGLRAYEGVEPVDWPAVTYAPMAGLPALVVPAWSGNLGHEPTPEMYVGHLVAVFREVRRVLRDDGVVWLNLGDSYFSSGSRANNNGEGASTMGWPGQRQETLNKASGIKLPPIQTDALKPKDLMMIPSRAALALQADGWWLRSDVIWAKSNPMPESVTDRPTKAHEYIYLLSKSERYYYDAEAIREKNQGELPWGKSSGNYKTAQAQATIGGKHGSTSMFSRKMSREERLVYSVSGRNKRTVWEINTKPFPGAHFAVFPDDLPDVCLRAGASERGCCPNCGAPWARVVERESRYEKREPAHAPNSEPTKVDSSGWKPPLITENGWQPICECGDHEPVPCLTLDPFCGAGTTGLVALRQGHRFIGIEPSAKYALMATERIANDAPMFNWSGLVRTPERAGLAPAAGE